MSNRAERHLCKKAHHPYAKVMEDGSVICINCDVVIKEAPESEND